MVSMGDTRIVSGFELKADPCEFARLLGAGRKNQKEPRIEEYLKRAGGLAGDLCRTDAVYGLWPLASVAGLIPMEWNQGACSVALAAVTVGAGIETRVTELGQEGTVTDALLLDAYASALVEAAADAIEGLIRKEGASLGLGAHKRRSPGYGVFQIEKQADLLRILGAEEIGITLMNSMIMSPQKSISFAMTLGSGFPKEASGQSASKCEDCDSNGCSMRSLTGEE